MPLLIRPVRRTLPLLAFAVLAMLLPAAQAAQVTELKAVHREGQTFLSWNEADSPAKEEALTIPAFKALMKEWTPKVAYRIYRSDKPIASVQGLTPVGETGPLSCWNNAFPDAQGHTFKPTDPMTRFVIAEGQPPLAPSTGLYVHNPATAGQGYYAVAFVNGGKEDAALATLKDPVDEKPGQGVPVLQSVQQLGPKETFNFIEGPTLRTYIRWQGPVVIDTTRS